MFDLFIFSNQLLLPHISNDLCNVGHKTVLQDEDTGTMASTLPLTVTYTALFDIENTTQIGIKGKKKWLFDIKQMHTHPRQDQAHQTSLRLSVHHPLEFQIQCSSCICQIHGGGIHQN